MSKQEDKQIHVVITGLAGSTTVDAPAGQIAPEGADAANVHTKTAAFSGGKQSAAVFVTTAGVKFANPAAIILSLLVISLAGLC